MISFPRTMSDEVKNPILVNLTRYNESNYILDEIDDKPAAHVLFYIASSLSAGTDEKVLVSVILEKKTDPHSFIQILYDLAVKINAQPGLEKGLYYSESEPKMDSIFERNFILLRDLMASYLDQIRNQLTILKNTPTDMRSGDGWA